ncbi:lasso peptide biosynthesis PqqD family chaperone [Desulfobacter latus]|uniref:Lasso peptide biosynthesis PqqD family chaperone n=1 Tax=Desulfobacter latus TaxID=2292 RepID=A0A850T3M8_9BACT|nr:lasso peptide biosynthesis PqqD family chaperone [Desulfobacter latus]NWH03405.1 lasso peptide biosynthesis PqqD family chaperone [Desulfobacter latus]
MILDTKVTRSDEVLTSEVDGEVVMMSIDAGTYSGLDAIGSKIWELLEKPITVSEICDIMMSRYDVERDVCEKDVLSFLEDLASDNTIRIVDADR